MARKGLTICLEGSDKTAGLAIMACTISREGTQFESLELIALVRLPPLYFPSLP